MPILTTNASHDFLFAKLHGMWAHAVKEAALEKLVRSSTVEALQRALHDIGLDGSKREIFHKDLVQRELHTLHGVARLLDPASAEFYTALVARSYFDDLKALLHYRFFPEREADLSWLLIQPPGIPELNVKALLDAKDTNAFLAAIPMEYGMTKDLFRQLIAQLEKTQDIMAAEGKLDVFHYQALMRAAQASPGGMRGEAVRLVQLEEDAVNISMLLRNVRTYRLTEERLQGFWMPDGTLPPKRLGELSRLPCVPQVVAQLPYPYHKLLDPFREAELHLCEYALWKNLYKQASRIFADFDHPSRSIAAFPFLIHFETLNIGRVYEGVHFGIPPRDIQDMMIGA